MVLINALMDILHRRIEKEKNEPGYLANRKTVDIEIDAYSHKKI